jgi:hypothetical protein
MREALQKVDKTGKIYEQIGEKLGGAAEGKTDVKPNDPSGDGGAA